MPLRSIQPITIDWLEARGLNDAAASKAAAKVAEIRDRATAHVRNICSTDGKLDNNRINANQLAAHAVAFVAVWAEGAREMLDYGRRMRAQGRALETAQSIGFIATALSEVSSQIDLGTGEKLAVSEIGIDAATLARELSDAGLGAFISAATGAEMTGGMARAIGESGKFGDPGDDDDTLMMIRDQFRKFVDGSVMPVAHHIHLKDELIPMEMIGVMGEMGVFGLTVPEQYGGSGMGKIAMVVVTEELSRGYIGVGSIGTRAEIAAELILGGGTEEQKEYWLPKIASGEVLPTAVFTEPGYGSDLANLKARAVKTTAGWNITGQKTWITHASRADLMTVLARSDPNAAGYKGLSMFLAPKERVLPGGKGETEKGFELDGLQATELPVIGYRGMKEYELSFEDFSVPADGLLGGTEGNGFKQLMTTFESARIQTAARAVGVAVNAMETGYKFAQERVQFGTQIYNFPRVFNKVVRSAMLIQGARQLTYFSARQKDSDKRCDLEAGMAKLFAGWVAWQAADAALQIHGGNGFSMEFPISRILCDARVLSIFEGAAEIQSTVIARRLLEG